MDVDERAVNVNLQKYCVNKIALPVENFLSYIHCFISGNELL